MSPARASALANKTEFRTGIINIDGFEHSFYVDGKVARPRALQPHQHVSSGCLQNQCETHHILAKCSFSYKIMVCHHFRYQILASRSWLPDPGYQILAARSWLDDPGFQILGTRSWLSDRGDQFLDTTSKLPHLGYQIPAGCQILASGYQILADPIYQILATRSWQSDSGYQILATRSWLPDLGYQIQPTTS